jgi:lysozyme
MITQNKQAIKSAEGLCLTAYLDGGGVWTIGYGHTGADVRAGLTIPLSEAERLLTRDLRTAEGHVNDAVQVKLTQNQFDALVSFVYNVGGGAFRSSTLLKLLNAGDYEGAANQLLRWDKDNGKSVKGLANRRQGERKLFLGGSSAA